MSDAIQRQLDDLQRMTTGDLVERYEELHGHACRTRHRAYLIRKIAWRIQANAEGDLTERARRRAAELADDAEIRTMAPRSLVCPPQPGEIRTRIRSLDPRDRRDPRLPSPGSAIVRQYKGRTIRVTVLTNDEGFEFDGERFRTLSSVAAKVTGQHINGFRFFGLRGGR